MRLRLRLRLGCNAESRDCRCCSLLGTLPCSSSRKLRSELRCSKELDWSSIKTKSWLLPLVFRKSAVHQLTQQFQRGHVLPLQATSSWSDVCSRNLRRLQIDQTSTAVPENADAMMTYTQKFDATVRALSRSEYAKKLDPNKV
ncbi:uncharacterized protein M421DRAFT_426054 [Didymella exigua CBS 183.55]|uniref:Uncharacterized protein n=1 Tax=Didymella exigua CBS 183.55 TaxID=1150837 RepID=A0A6A5R8D0_9PLEO|nr:uncharacterized protein M421DRAFT_426054 [Didymella exigua CBS 183.55]KAF1923234.1 hypothetical protein M421DRAFT_426054 [Didymella exigua CBS 183.55]